MDVNAALGHHPAMPTARIALVGDRSPSVRAHARIPLLVEALRRRDDIVLDPYWVPSEAAHDGLEGFDAIWMVPGSPYRDRDGALAAVLEQARARLRRRDRAAVQQRGAEVGLERGDVLRHRRLRVAELARGRGERGETGH